MSEDTSRRASGITHDDLYWLQRLDRDGLVRTSRHHERALTRLIDLGMAERHPRGGIRLNGYGREFMTRFKAELRERASMSIAR